jgi:thioesterase domain-containing protein
VQGESVALLALLDTWSPTVHHQTPAYEDDDAFLLALLARGGARAQGADAALTPEDFRRLKPEEQLEYLKRANLVASEINLSQAQSFLNGFRARQRAMRNYNPQVYTGRITQYRAADEDAWLLEQYRQAGVNTKDAALGWSGLSTEPVETHLVPGFHEKMCSEPYVQTLAEALQTCFNKIESVDAAQTVASTSAN